MSSYVTLGMLPMVWWGALSVNAIWVPWLIMTASALGWVWVTTRSTLLPMMFIVMTEPLLTTLPSNSWAR